MIRPRVLTVWTRRTNGLETKLLRSCVTRVQSARLHFRSFFLRSKHEDSSYTKLLRGGAAPPVCESRFGRLCWARVDRAANAVPIHW
jgi:hypothetical protein